MNRDRKSGKLILISFNNLDQFINFDPVEVERKSIEYYKANGRRTPTKIYKEHGLNIAVLSVDLRTPGQVFKPKAVKEASRIITSRAA